MLRITVYGGFLFVCYCCFVILCCQHRMGAPLCKGHTVPWVLYPRGSHFGFTVQHALGGQGKWAWLYRKEPYRHRLEMNVFFSCQKVLPQPLKNAEVIPTAGAAQCRPVLLTLVLTSICRKDCKDSPDCPQTQSFKMCYLKVLNYSKHFIARKNTREKKTQLGCPFALRM